MLNTIYKDAAPVKRLSKLDRSTTKTVSIPNAGTSSEKVPARCFQTPTFSLGTGTIPAVEISTIGKSAQRVA